jgi:hypothetical protein
MDSSKKSQIILPIDYIPIYYIIFPIAIVYLIIASMFALISIVTYSFLVYSSFILMVFSMILFLYVYLIFTRLFDSKILDTQGFTRVKLFKFLIFLLVPTFIFFYFIFNPTILFFEFYTVMDSANINDLLNISQTFLTVGIVGGSLTLVSIGAIVGAQEDLSSKKEEKVSRNRNDNFRIFSLIFSLITISSFVYASMASLFFFYKYYTSGYSPILITAAEEAFKGILAACSLFLIWIFLSYILFNFYIFKNYFASSN